MQFKIFMNQSLSLTSVILCVVLVRFCSWSSAWAATITQTSTDASGYSSFNSGSHWSNGLGPRAGNDYGSATTLRTPADSGSYTFAGDSLTLNSGGCLVFKGTTNAAVITVNPLLLRSGSLVVNAMTTNPFTLAGSVIVDSGNVANFQVTTPNCGYTISATISGAGGVTFTTTCTSQSAQAITLVKANLYSGGTTVSTYAYVIAAADGALGQGDVTVLGGNLTLQAATGNAIADSARFTVAPSLAVGAVKLNYTGTEAVGAFSLNGGVTYLADGIYTVAQLNSLYGGSVFSGSGSIQVNASGLITQTASDPAGASSFNTGTRWSDGTAPGVRRDYATSTTLRTPPVSGAYTFGGDSLTLNSGGALVFKGTAATDILTVNHLYLLSGSTVVNAMSTNPFTLAGDMVIPYGQTANFQVMAPNYGYTISSIIGGSGAVKFTSTYTLQGTRSIVLESSNTYAGGTTVETYASVIAAADGAFGTGSVTVNGGKLTLQSGKTNNYLSDSAAFRIAKSLAAGTVTLNYTGTDRVGSLSLDGGKTFLADGTYTVGQLNSLYGASVFAGTGQIEVNVARLNTLQGYVSTELSALEAGLATSVPEPTTRDLAQGALTYILREANYVRSRQLLDYLFALQDMNPVSTGYGTFPWQQNHPEIVDPNAVEFTMLPLGPLFLNYSSGFPADFQTSALSHLQAALVAVTRHQVSVTYTNIFLMRATNLILLGQYLNDTMAQNEGEAALDQWIAYVRANGVSEFDSSVYSGVQINVLTTLYNNVRTARIQAKVKVMLDYLWADVAANYFVAGQELSGATSRTYSFLKHDYNLNGHYYLDGIQPIASNSVGILSEDGLTSANGKWGKYSLESKFYDLSRISERVIVQKWGSGAGQDRYTYITPNFAIGSASRYYCQQDRPVSVHLASSKKLPILGLIPDAFDAPYGKVQVVESSGHTKIEHLKYAISAVQEKGALLTLLDLGPGITDEANAGLPVTSAATNLILPYLADGIYLNGIKVTWSQSVIALSSQSTVGVLEGTTGVAIRLFHADAAQSGVTPTYYLKNDGKNFTDFPSARLVAYHTSGSAPVPAVATVRSGVLILIATCNDATAFQSFLAQASQWTFTETLSGNLWQVTAQPPAGAPSLPVLAASLDLAAKVTGPRTVNGGAIVPKLLTVNGVDWAQIIWSGLDN